MDSVPRNKAGADRRAVRDQWNLNELDIATLFADYDSDESGMLEVGEFQALLTDYNGGKAPSEEEFDWMMKIADKNHDEMISKDELLYAMQAWHGYTHMESEYSELFEKYDVDHNGSLDVSELTELLTSLNNGIAVPTSQAEAVLKQADVMGNGSIGRFELLGAVGHWFVKVGRQPTPQMLIAMKAMEKQPALSCSGMLLQLLVVFMCFYYGSVHRNDTCDQPLATLLYAEGGVILGIGMCGIMWVKCCTGNPILVCLLTILNLAYAAINITGIVLVLQSSPTTCNAELYEICWYFYLLVPLINLALLCCVCCSACMVAMSAHDQNLQDMDEPQGNNKYAELKA